jgi:hypothetical protein
MVMKTRPAGAPRRPSTSPFRDRPAPVIEIYEVGDRVTHDKFGLGMVVDREPAAVVVDFGSQRTRVASPFTRLTKL